MHILQCRSHRINRVISQLSFELLCVSRGTECKALSSRSSSQGTIVRSIGSKSSEARFGRRCKFGATKASGVCRFTSYLESSHLLVTPASWPTYRDRHITNVTLCSRVCTHEHDRAAYMCACYTCIQTHIHFVLQLV